MGWKEGLELCQDALAALALLGLFLAPGYLVACALVNLFN